jgi:sn-glycerol 3-phosphate transport system ATP-binding protein
MNVYDNMAYGLRNRRTPKGEIETRVSEAARILEIGDYLKRKPRELSGGQRQRVAMGRAIVRRPKVFLFDEPLSNLDAKLRVSMRVEIKKLQRAFATTSLYVTHDQLEAMTLADILVVMNGGLVEQIGAPLDIYHKPATTFVAAFIGAPPMNLLPVKGVELAGMLGERLAPQSDTAIAGVRPEDFILVPALEPVASQFHLPLTVEAVERIGPESYIYGALARGGQIIVRQAGQDVPPVGEHATAVAPLDKLHLFTADGRGRIDIPGV